MAQQQSKSFTNKKPFILTYKGRDYPCSYKDEVVVVKGENGAQGNFITIGNYNPTIKQWSDVKDCLPKKVMHECAKRANLQFA